MGARVKIVAALNTEFSEWGNILFNTTCNIEHHEHHNGRSVWPFRMASGASDGNRFLLRARLQRAVSLSAQCSRTGRMTVRDELFWRLTSVLLRVGVVGKSYLTSLQVARVEQRTN